MSLYITHKNQIVELKVIHAQLSSFFYFRIKNTKKTMNKYIIINAYKINIISYTEMIVLILSWELLCYK